jgi:hypothetical protein
MKLVHDITIQFISPRNQLTNNYQCWTDGVPIANDVHMPKMSWTDVLLTEALRSIQLVGPAYDGVVRGRADRAQASSQARVHGHRLT